MQKGMKKNNKEGQEATATLANTKKKTRTEASVAAVLPELGSIFTLRENVIQRSTAGHVFTLLLISDFGMSLVKLHYFTFFFLTLIICFYS